MGGAIDHMPRSEALSLISRYLPSLGTEWITLTKSCGRVAAVDVRSRFNLPAVKCSRWDGIAFNYANFVKCGQVVSGWELGVDYCFSNTGIPIVQDNFDTMVMIEQTTFSADNRLISINQPDIAQGQNVALPGDRIAAGEVLVPVDTPISPSYMNLMASGGVTNVLVYKRPRVAIIPTGNELVPLGLTPGAQQTIDSNSVSMCAKVKLWGGEAVPFPIQPDEPAQIRARLLEAAAIADLIVIGGGSGRGQRDLLQQTVSELGELYFSSVEHGPAKRTCFAVVEGIPVIGLVGPPGGEEMSFDFYVMPAIKAALHQTWRPTRVKAILDEEVPAHHRVSFYYTLRVYRDDVGQIHARTLAHADIDRNIAAHNGYLFVEKPSGGYKKGDVAEVELRTGCENI